MFPPLPIAEVIPREVPPPLVFLGQIEAHRGLDRHHDVLAGGKDDHEQDDYNF